jgi:hypothetical protein
MNMEPQAGVPITMLIDGSHVDRLKSKLGQVIDLDRLVMHFRRPGRPVRPAYYRDSRDFAEQARLERFFGWLHRHGIERRGSDDFDEPWYVRERYGSNLVALAADAVAAATEGHDLVLLAGDAKLISVLRQLKAQGATITLISSRSVPPSIAPPPPLTDLADTFIDLNEDRRFFLLQNEDGKIR